MVTIACPWCDEEVALPAALLVLEPLFICPDCATSVALVGEAEEPVELAA
jgi:hypothetical protein